MSKTVTIPLDVAVMVRDVFLPLNPNKMRGAATGVREAAHAFKMAVAQAQFEHFDPLATHSPVPCDHQPCVYAKGHLGDHRPEMGETFAGSAGGNSDG